MLVNLKQILEIAENSKYAVGAFNTPNLESLMAVIAAAEDMNVPVIIQHAEVHETVIPIAVIGPIMVEFAKKSTVPVCVQLDHGETFEYIKKALDIGFTAIMYDGSSQTFEENTKNTKYVVDLAADYQASVEGEIGDMGKRNTVFADAKNNNELDKIYTDPDEAKRFVEATGIDALACSFGTTHGFYLSEPRLDMNIITQVRERVQIPVVMHGGSGVSDTDFYAAIDHGVRKVNYYTYMAKAGAEYVKSKLQEVEMPVYFHEIANWGVEGITADVKKAICVFSKSCEERDAC